MSDGHYKQADRSSRTGSIRCCEHTAWDERSIGAGNTEYARVAEVTKHLGMARATRFINAAGYAVHIVTAGVAGYTARGGPAGIIRQHVSGGRYEFLHLELL